MQMHVKLPVEASHFDRWLELFEATATELCSPQVAAYFIDKARRIADSLEMGIASQQGRIHSPRHVPR
jgi:hemoglobin